MGAETAAAIGAWISANAGAVTAGAAAVSAGAAVYGGVEASEAAKKNKTAAENDASRKAQIEQRGNEMLSSEQKVAFLNSGVILEGSPLLVLERTRSQGIENVDAIRTYGANMGSALEAQGRSALYGGIASGIGSASSVYRNTQTTQQNRI